MNKPALRYDGRVNIHALAGRELLRQAVADYEAAWKQAATTGDLEDKRKFNRAKDYLGEICAHYWIGSPHYTGDPTRASTECIRCGCTYHPYFDLEQT